MFSKLWVKVSIRLIVLLLIVLPMKRGVALTGIQPGLRPGQHQDAPESGALETFVDGFLQENMERHHVPGLVITVVQEGEVVLSKGYGYADIEKKIPMTPQTAVRAGSGSKPVLASVVIRLAAQGLLDLNAPVSDYITDLDLEDEFGQASTVAQLLNHMGGYENGLVLTHAPTIDEWQPLGLVLKEDLPPRAFAPGKVMSYSSWGYALLGYATEQVTGVPYEEAVARELFTPLGMEGSTFLQPLPPAIHDNLATGYGYNEGSNTFDVIPHDFVRMSPGVALVTNAEDMGKYMLALLDGGAGEETKLFDAQSLAWILERQASAHPYSRGRSYAFAETTLSGRKVLYHDGNGIGFTNRIVLVPGQSMGFFISVNHRSLGMDLSSTRATEMVRNLSSAIVENLVPASESEIPDVQPLPDAKERIEKFVGYYQFAEVSRRDFFKANALLDNVTVKGNGDGTLKIGSRDYVEVEPDLFQSKESPDFFVVFVENDQEEVEFLTFGGTGSYQKVSWTQSLNAQIAFVAPIVLVFLSFAILWPMTRQGHWLAWVVSLLGLGFWAGVALLFTGMADLLLFFKTIPANFRLLSFLPWLIGILALVLPVFLGAIWKNGSAPLWAKIHYTLANVAAFALVWFAYFWRMIVT